MNCTFRAKEPCTEPATKIIIFKAGTYHARELCPDHFNYFVRNSISTEEFKTIEARDLALVKRSI